MSMEKINALLAFMTAAGLKELQKKYMKCLACAMAKLEFTEEVTAASGAKQISSSPRETIVLRLSL